MSIPGQAEVRDARILSTAEVPRARAQVQRLSLAPGRTARMLAAISLGFAVLNLLVQVAHFFMPDFFMRDVLFIMFNVGGEANLPSVFSSLLLLFAALILGTVGLSKRQLGEHFSRHWLILSAVFLFLSLDEVAQIHDNLSVPLYRLMHLGGILTFAWVLPYSLLVLILLLGFIRFLAHLPAPTRRLFLLAAAIYVVAALVLEFVQGYITTRFGDTNFLGVLSVGIEEPAEMLGMVLFIYALLTYVQRQMSGFALQLNVAPEAGPPGGR